MDSTLFPKFVRPAQLSKLLAVSPRTIRQWQSSRLIPFHKIGKTVLFDLKKVQAAVDRFERTAGGLN
jgi:excisionase family DNA binding protein